MFMLFGLVLLMPKPNTFPQDGIKTTELTGNLAADAQISHSIRRRNDLTFRLSGYAAKLVLPKGSIAGDTWSDYDDLHEGRPVRLSIAVNRRDDLSDVDADITVYAIAVAGRTLLTERDFRENHRAYDRRLGIMLSVLGCFLLFWGIFLPDKG